jgi:hypothetical protein
MSAASFKFESASNQTKVSAVAPEAGKPANISLLLGWETGEADLLSPDTLSREVQRFCKKVLSK